MKKEELKKNLVLLMIVFILFCLIFEILVRIIWAVPDNGGYPQGLIKCDPEILEYKLNPNYNGSYSGKGYESVEINTNSKGLRDYEHDYEKKQGVLRILGLGDSVTFGAGISYEDTYLRILEKKLQREGKNIEIIKAAVSGYNFDQIYNYYLTEGYKYDPDIVIYAFVPNDIRPTNLTETKKEIEETGDCMPLESSLEKGVKKYCKTCVLVYTLIFHYDKLYYEDVFNFWKDKEKKEYFSSKLIDLNNELKEKNITFVILLFPFTPQFENDANYGYYLQEEVKKIALENNILVIDLAPYLDVPEFREYFLPKDISHLNPQGNYFIAENLYEELTKRKIL